MRCRETHRFAQLKQDSECGVSVKSVGHNGARHSCVPRGELEITQHYPTIVFDPSWNEPLAERKWATCSLIGSYGVQHSFMHGLKNSRCACVCIHEFMFKGVKGYIYILWRHMCAAALCKRLHVLTSLPPPPPHHARLHMQNRFAIYSRWIEYNLNIIQLSVGVVVGVWRGCAFALSRLEPTRAYEHAHIHSTCCKTRQEGKDTETPVRRRQRVATARSGGETQRIIPYIHNKEIHSTRFAAPSRIWDDDSLTRNAIVCGKRRTEIGREREGEREISLPYKWRAFVVLALVLLLRDGFACSHVYGFLLLCNLTTNIRDLLLALSTRAFTAKVPSAPSGNRQQQLGCVGLCDHAYLCGASPTHAVMS